MESYSSMSIRNYTLHISFPRNNCLFCDIDIDQFPFKNKKKIPTEQLCERAMASLKVVIVVLKEICRF